MADMYQLVEDALVQTAGGALAPVRARTLIWSLLVDVANSSPNYRQQIDQYREGLKEGDVRQIIGKASTIEQILLYGTRNVSVKVAQERLVHASPIEKGLIKAYHPGVTRGVETKITDLRPVRKGKTEVWQ